MEVADEPGLVGDARRGERDGLEVEVARRLRRSAGVAADDEDADGVGLLLADARDEPADEPFRQVRELYGSSPVRTSEYRRDSAFDGNERRTPLNGGTSTTSVASVSFSSAGRSSISASRWSPVS